MSKKHKKNKTHKSSVNSSISSSDLGEDNLFIGNEFSSMGGSSIEFDCGEVSTSSDLSLQTDTASVLCIKDPHAEEIIEGDENEGKAEVIINMVWASNTDESTAFMEDRKSTVETFKEPEPKSDTDGRISKFISDPRSSDLTSISSISTSLSHHNLKYLHEDCGFNKTILNIAAIELSLKGLSCENADDLLASYQEMSEKRLQDSDFYNFIEEHSSRILSLQEELRSILKEKADKSLMCVECEKNLVSILFIPCGHIVLCDECHKEVSEVCRCCGSRVRESHHVFF